MFRFLASSTSRRWHGLRGWLFGALVLAGCAAHTERPANYAVHFSVTRTADHAPVSSTTVPAVPGGERKVKTIRKQPAENQPVATEFLVRLDRTKQPGVYELVTRVTVKEVNRDKKGKLKVSKRNIGALVPTRLGEIQLVSVAGDAIRVEARLERR